jgi:putative spermidine/putrescine transport system substrate-binding protein
MHEREFDDLLKRLEEEEDGNLSRRDLLKRGGVLGAALAGLSFAGSAAARSFGSAPPSNGATYSFSELVSEAKDEGKLNTIALPPDWANYGVMMSTFQKKYGIKITNASPNASSADELQAVKSLKGQSRAPDVLDISPSIAAQGVKEQLFAPYKTRLWGTVPAFMKQPQGLWTGDYWGVISFGANRKVVQNQPRSWADLLKPEYKGQVALNGDPRTSGSAFAGVFSAALANGGSLDNIQPGIDFYAKLKDAGNFILVDATPATVASGQTPVTIDWDYLQIAYGKEFSKDINWTVSVPAKGVFGNFYCQAINKEAPNPYAARLWEEFLYSNQGQLIWLAGYSHPARYADLARKGLVPAALKSKLPPAAAYAHVGFPNPTQTAKAEAIINEQWGPKVAGS